ncbi:hypothetical protein EG68_06659 [Paragonimus skrjabini miyazakii]|uniref:Ciliogenesis-associated TTC17-interacting protein N-terminal domain-containing protein n=1 Tax=Paragonimus skrjabini miyazakii TaxID=59628 RepID=A0A8S9YTB8_9TREM|nr:hypothetical protein EG68_06659 [Paragonimus skrjabini miyazakii]
MNEYTFYDSLGTQGIPRYFADAKKISASNDALLSFINSISNDDIASVLFEDSLECFATTDNVIGSYECKVNRETASCGLELIRVTASSHANIEGLQYHIQLDALLTGKLETTSQTQKETTVFNGRTLTKVTRLNKITDGYEINRELVENDEKSHDNIFYTNECLEGFISEGANLILQRLMTNKKSLFPFEAVGLDSDCVPCLLTYVDLGDRNIVLKGEEINTSGIERRLQSSATIPTSWQMYFMTDGHLVLRMQAGSPVTMKVSEIPKRFVQDQYLRKPDIITNTFDWQEDTELSSRFLSRKDAIKADHFQYLRNNPVVNDMLSDFLQALLMHKPENTVEFAIEYSKNTSSHSLPTRLFLSTNP